MILVHIQELSSFCNLLWLTNNADVDSLCICIDFTSFIRFQYNSEFFTKNVVSYRFIQLTLNLTVPTSTHVKTHYLVTCN